MHLFGLSFTLSFQSSHSIITGDFSFERDARRTTKVNVSVCCMLWLQFADSTTYLNLKNPALSGESSGSTKTKESVLNVWIEPGANRDQVTKNVTDHLVNRRFAGSTLISTTSLRQRTFLRLHLNTESKVGSECDVL